MLADKEADESSALRHPALKIARAVVTTAVSKNSIDLPNLVYRVQHNLKIHKNKTLLFSEYLKPVSM